VTLRDFRFRDPTNPLAKDDPSGDKDFERYDYPGGFCVRDSKKPDGSPKEDAADYDEIILEDDTDTAATKNFAKIRREEAEMFKERAEGQSNCPRFTPGYIFELTDHDLGDFDKEYVLFEVVHTGSQPQVLEASATRFENATYSNEFLCIPDTVTFRPLGYSHGLTGSPPSETFRPLKDTPKPVVKGPQTAIVVKADKKKGITPKSPATDDDNVYTDKYGRVKVRFHWERPHGQGDDEYYHSAWVRVSQAWAGQGWGAMHIPHVGQEVIVDFLEGDPDRPIITGRIYNQANMPHNANDDVRDTMNPSVNKHISGFRDEYGNKLIFDATSGQENVVLKSPKNNSYLSLGEPGAELKTDKDVVQRVFGNIVEAGCGSKFEALFGLGFEGKLAQTYEFVIGQVFEFFAGQKVEIGFGTEFEYKLTKDLKAVDGDIEHECKKDFKLTAGDGFNIIGGTKDDSDNQTAISAFADGIMLSLGKEKSLDTPTKPDSLAKVSWGLFGTATIVGAISAVLAKTFDAVGEGTDVDEWTFGSHSFGTLTSVIALTQAIISTYIGWHARDSVEPSFHKDPSAVFGINEGGITFGINPDLAETKTKLENIRGDLKLFSRKLGLLADGLNFKKAYQRKKEVDKLKDEENEIWKEFIKKSLGEETVADSKIMMKEDGSISINSAKNKKEIELSIGAEAPFDAGLKLSEKGVGINSGASSISIEKDKNIEITSGKADVAIQSDSGNIDLIAGKKVRAKGTAFDINGVLKHKNFEVLA
jgi:hypothetical protein